MAELQGFFLKHKDDPLAALDNVSHIHASIVHQPVHEGKHQQDRKHTSSDGNSIADIEDTGNSDAGDGQNGRVTSCGPRGRRMLTALELDKMTFNPQYDWEKDIYSGPK